MDGKRPWGLPLQCLYLRLFGGVNQASLTDETFLDVTEYWGLGYEININSFLSVGFNSPPR